MGKKRIAVIGAGVAGLVFARLLDKRAELVIYEKSKGLGGRVATRYAGEFEFDHGAQFFTARSEAFQRFLDPLVTLGKVANWPARFAELDRSVVTNRRDWSVADPHYVGVPRMNVIGDSLAEGLDIRQPVTVATVDRDAGGWRLTSTADEGLGTFDWVVLAVPPRQAAALVPDSAFVATATADAHMHACFALMLGFEDDPKLEWDAALVRNADISWVSVNSTKPGRKRLPTLVVHSTNAWANEHLDMNIEAVRQHLLAEASSVTGLDLGSAEHSQLQRWRFANMDARNGPKSLVETGDRLAICGDWLIRGRVEAAFTSGYHLAQMFESHL